MFITTINFEEENHYNAHQRVKGIFPDGNACFRFSSGKIQILSEYRPLDLRDAKLINRIIKPGKNRFKLRTHYVKRDKITKKNIPACPYKFKDWLIEKIGSSAKIINFSILKEEFIEIKKEHKFFLYSIDIEGFIEILDEKIFEKVILKGIGKKKSFGFGALILD